MFNFSNNLTQDLNDRFNMSIKDFSIDSQKMLTKSMNGVYFPLLERPSHEKIEPTKIPNSLLHSSNGLNHMMLDRIVNNIRHIRLIDPASNLNNSCVFRMVEIIKQLAKIVMKNIPISIAGAFQGIFKLAKDSTVRELTISDILNSIKEVFLETGKVSFHATEALSNVLPMYWNIVTGLITTPIKVPFVHDWFTNKFTRYFSFAIIIKGTH